jgi:hypothetical protein
MVIVMDKNKLKIHANKFRFYLLMHVEIAHLINGDSYGKNKLKTHTNKFRFFLLMHVEIAHHINGDSYGKKINLKPIQINSDFIYCCM